MSTSVYLAQCGETDPDSNDHRVTVLGIFTSLKLANNAFSLSELRTEKDGSHWWARHHCFRGVHEVVIGSREIAGAKRDEEP